MKKWGQAMSRRIAKSVKEEIIGKAQAGEQAADLAEQYAVSTKTIYAWLRQDTGEGVVSVLDYNKLKRENEELKRLIGELTLNMHLQKSRDSASCPDQGGVCLRAGDRAQEHLSPAEAACQRSSPQAAN